MNTFQNTFFYKELACDPLAPSLVAQLVADDPSTFPMAAIVPPLNILRHTTRTTYKWPFRERSKYIVRPETVLMAGNHFVWQHISKDIG